jgi:hypothetical protein
MQIGEFEIVYPVWCLVNPESVERTSENTVEFITDMPQVVAITDESGEHAIAVFTDGDLGDKFAQTFDKPVAIVAA